MSITSLPHHHRTGLQALGIIGGKPVWPVIGAAEDGGDGGDGGGQGADAGGEPAGGNKGNGDEGGSGADDFKSEHSKAAVLADLAGERDARKTAEAKLKEYEDRDKSDADKAVERQAALEESARVNGTKALKYEAAAAAGLPLTSAARLQGNTLEELTADAKALQAEMATAAGAIHHTAGAGAQGGGAAPVKTDPGLGTLTHAYETSARK